MKSLKQKALKEKSDLCDTYQNISVQLKTSMTYFKTKKERKMEKVPMQSLWTNMLSAEQFIIQINT